MLKKANRLTKHGSFNYVYRKGERVTGKCISLNFIKGRGVRVGFVVSNKIGKAVCRNLVKRRLRAAMQELMPGITGGQFIFTAHGRVCELDYAQIKAQVTDLLVRAGLLK